MHWTLRYNPLNLSFSVFLATYGASSPEVTLLRDEMKTKYGMKNTESDQGLSYEDYHDEL